jgi:hypothetical protein
VFRDFWITVLYMLRQTLRRRVSPLPFTSFSRLTVTFPKLAVILRPLYFSRTCLRVHAHNFRRFHTTFPTFLYFVT